MAYRLAWSPEAMEDIEAIASYIERDSLPACAGMAESKASQQGGRLPAPRQWMYSLYISINEFHT